MLKMLIQPQSFFGLWKLTLIDMDSKNLFINSIKAAWGPPNLELKRFCSFGVFSNSNFSVRMMHGRNAINRHDSDLFSQSASWTRLIWKEAAGSLVQMVCFATSRRHHCRDESRSFHHSMCNPRLNLLPDHFRGGDIANSWNVIGAYLSLWNVKYLFPGLWIVICIFLGDLWMCKLPSVKCDLPSPRCVKTWILLFWW